MCRKQSMQGEENMSKEKENIMFREVKEETAFIKSKQHSAEQKGDT